MKKSIILNFFIVSITVCTFVLCAINIIQRNKVSKEDKKLLNKKFYVPNITNIDNNIPRKIFQCYKTREDVPNKVFNTIKKLNPNWEYNFYDDKDCINFLEKFYGKEYVDKFNGFKSGAHKADLWRYCVLYIYGGVYIDIDL